jgi:hypothetical protein
VNTPIFFQDLWEHEFLNLMPSPQKILITGESFHPEFNISKSNLPSLYGGDCVCEASCVYSEKGPWSTHENKVNFRDRGDSGDEENKFNSNNNDVPRFESDSDDEDLLGRKIKPLVDRNDTEIRDLKHQLGSNIQFCKVLLF